MKEIKTNKINNQWYSSNNIKPKCWLIKQKAYYLEIISLNAIQLFTYILLKLSTLTLKCIEYLLEIHLR